MYTGLSEIQAIFLAALEQTSPEARAVYLDQACGANAELRNRVERLLQAQPKVADFLESPAPCIDVTVDAANDATAVVELPGTMIDRYKLVHEIGHGGMGVVYMAVQKEPVKRKVALKIIKPGMDTREVVARFEAERQALALMDHQSIAHVLDGGSTESGRPYFVMELVDGTPITEYCDAARFTTRQRLGLFIQVCQAVQHAHLKGVIHRDIKPSNILVTHDDGSPLPKVIDFGIAKAVHQPLTDASVHTQLSQMVGTPLYMSPEQAERTGQDVDTRTDVYSLGVLLYELLTGATPFDKERLKNSSLDEVKRIIQEEEPPKPSTRLSTLGAELDTIVEKHHTDCRTLTDELTGELDWIVMKALEKDRNRRYESASDFAKDVQRYLDDEAVEACPPTAVYRLGKFYRRNKRLLTTAALLVVVLMVGASVATWQAIVATNATTFAKQQQGIAEERLTQVDQQRQRAEANFQKAMGAVDEMLTRVGDKDLADIPGMESVRRDLLERALAYYQGFLEGRSDDPQVQLETARAQKRSGDILELFGKNEEAENAYLDAVKRFESMDSDDIPKHQDQYGLANSLTAISTLWRETGRHEQSIRAGRRARDIAKALATGSPEVAEFQAAMSDACESLGLTLDDLSRVEDAKAAYSEAIDVRTKLANQHPNVPDYRRELAALHVNVAILMDKTADYKEAEQSYRNALAIVEQLVSDFPDKAEYRDGLAIIQMNLGVLYYRTSRPDEAAASHREAIKTFKALVGDFPNIPVHRHKLAITYLNLGNSLLASNQIKEAEDAYDEAIKIGERLAEDFPGKPTYKTALAVCHNNVAALQEHAGRLEEAEQHNRSARKVRQQLVRDFPDIPSYRANLATSCNNLGIMLKDSERNQEAEECLRESLAIRKQLVEEFPDLSIYPDDLAMSYINLGVVLKKMQRFEEAETCYRESSELWKQLTEQESGAPRFRGRYAASETNLGQLLACTGRRADAENHLNTALRVWEQLVEDFPGIPEYRLGAAGAHTELGGLQKNLERRKEAEASYSKAITLLEKLTEDSPEVPVYCANLVKAHERLSALFTVGEGRTEEAEKHRRRADSLRSQLKAKFPEYKIESEAE